MADYTKGTDFATKDTLTTGNPLKVIKGTEIDDELNSLQTAVNSKANKNAPVITGTASLANVTISGTTTTTGAITATGGVVGDITGNVTGNVTGDLTGDVKATDGTVVLDNGTDGTDATFTGDVFGDLKLTYDDEGEETTVTILDTGTDGTDATFTGQVTTDGQILRPITYADILSASGVTSFEYTEVPSWVRRITILSTDFITTDGDQPHVQLGTSGGYVTSGYQGEVRRADSRNDFSSENAFVLAPVLTGVFNTVAYAVLSKMSSSSNQWMIAISSTSYANDGTDASSPNYGHGFVDVGGTLTSLKFFGTGSNAITTGNIQLIFE